jgi:hypothetical protein
MIVVRSLRSSRSKGEPDGSSELPPTSGHTIFRHELAAMPLERLIGMLSKKRPMMLMESGLQHWRS